MAAPAPRRDALRRAARVTAAACTGFYLCRYVAGDVTIATYAVFTAIALGALSDVQGTPNQRTRVLLTAVACGLGLVTIGTLTAATTWTAAAGMLVVGFFVAYAGVGGPRVAGVANGLQLFYVLPCFPPYAPDTLDERLAGVVVGGLLLAAADRWLWPPASPPPPGARLAAAAEGLAEYAGTLAEALRAPADATRVRERSARGSAAEAIARLRMTEIPVAQRPLGPGVRDRSLLVAGTATRTAAARLTGLGRLLVGPGAPAHPFLADLVAATAEAFAAVGTAAHAGGRRAAHAGPGPDESTSAGAGLLATGSVDAALAAYVDRRVRAREAVGPADALRAGLAAVAAAEEARIAVLAVRGVVGAPPPDPAATPPTLWFLHAGPFELWWRRLQSHLTPRSVYLQNAVRLALGLAAARVVAGSFDLSHGFWVLLATLSLMRTSAAAGRAVLVSAFAGTVAGAVVGGGILAVVGDRTDVYAWALPLTMVLAFAAGPVLGVAAAQGGFTVVVALLFAQVAPATWQLAEVRLLDVVVGGLVGAVIGAAVWPRGGGGELRRVTAATLRAAAAEVESTVGHLAGDRATPPSDLHRLSVLVDHTYAQYRTEPASGRPEPDWLTVLAIVHRLDRYSAELRDQHAGTTAAPPRPEVAAALRAAACDVAGAYRAAADAVRSGSPLPVDAGAGCRARFRVGDGAGPPAPSPEAALRVLDAWGWLYALADDVDLLEHAFRLTTGPSPTRPRHGDRPAPGRHR
jgi:uncharacterized membrane protein YccC